jgi:hypothetical protein
VGSVGPRELGARGREEQEPAARVPAAQVPVPAAQVPVPAAREAVEMG